MSAYVLPTHSHELSRRAFLGLEMLVPQGELCYSLLMHTSEKVAKAKDLMLRFCQ